MTAQAKDHPSQIPAMLQEAFRRHNAGEIAVAEVLYRRIIDMDAKNFDALHMLAVVGYTTNQITPSLELFARAKAIKPNEFPLLVNYGATLRKNKQYAEALSQYDIALSVKPNSYEPLFNKACCLFEIEEFEAAEVCYRQCLVLKPNNSEVQRCIGNCLKFKGEWVEAVEWYERAIESKPNDANARVAIAQVFRDRGWLASALLLCDQALRLDSRNEAALAISSLVALKRGELVTGWKNYEGRFWYADDQILRRPVPPMYWDGEDLAGKNMLIWSEQGVGDEILYASMLPDLLARSGKVIFECDPRMVPVYSRSYPGLVAKPWEKRHVTATPAKGIDFQSSVVSLGRFFRTSFDLFPQHKGYLKADPDKVRVCKQRYGTGPLIGISWRSSATRNVGPKKSSVLADWEPILRTPGVTFINLQYGECQQEIADAKNRFGVNIIEDAAIDSLKDIDGFFAQVAAMDLVLSTSNTTVHVAGALGVPVWMLLSDRSSPLWYWFTNRNDSPWYPSMRIIQERTDADRSQHWSCDLVNQVSMELPTWLAGRVAA
jgi:Tfp pilus assembly protein PilF